MFQFLIGIINPEIYNYDLDYIEAVSIPYRYYKSYLLLIIVYARCLVSIPYRYYKSAISGLYSGIYICVSIPYRYYKSKEGF